MKRTLAFLLCLMMITMPLFTFVSTVYGEEVKRPRLLIESGAVSPEIVSGNEDIELSVSIQNIGTAPACYVTVSACAEDEEIVLVSDLNGEFVERIAAGDTEELVFVFRTVLHAKDGEHRLRVTAKYEDESGQERMTEAVFRAPVHRDAEIFADEIELPATLESGSSFSLPISVFNPSDAAAYNIRATLAVNGLICSSAFFDRLAPGEQSEKEMSIFVMEIGSGKKNGDTEGVFKITYEDSNGAQKELSMPVKSSIIAPQDLTLEEEARIEQERIKKSTLSKWWVSTLAAIAVIAILCSSIIVGKLVRLVKMK